MIFFMCTYNRRKISYAPFSRVASSQDGTDFFIHAKWLRLVSYILQIQYIDVFTYIDFSFLSAVTHRGKNTYLFSMPDKLIDRSNFLISFNVIGNSILARFNTVM